MSKILWVVGLILVALGILLGVKTMMSPGQMLILGLTPETAAILLVGGIISLGLGSVINALSGIASTPVAMPVVTMPEVTRTVVAEMAAEPAEDVSARIPGFGRKTAEVAGAAAVATVAIVETKSTAPAAMGSVADTIAALEQAKSDIKTALGGVDSMTAPEENIEPIHAISVEPVEVAPAEGELYVVEEKIIRGRPSRILSDDTVEAETDEGWMRFENLEHLNEYLDSMEPPEA